MGLKMPFGDGLKDAIWCDRNFVGGWAYRCHSATAGRRMGLQMPSGHVELYVNGEWISVGKASLFWNISELGSEQATD